MAPSNDGTMLAFTVLRAPPRPRLFVRPLSSDVSREIPGTADARFPFWSPDNKQIGFFAAGELRIVDIDGRATPTPIARVASPVGGSWGPGGLILFAGDPGVIYRVHPGENPVAVTKRGAEAQHILPKALPDGHHFLFSSSRGGVFVGDARRSQRRYRAGRGSIIRWTRSSRARRYRRERVRAAGGDSSTRCAAPGSRRPRRSSDSRLHSYTVSATGVLALSEGADKSYPIWLTGMGHRSIQPAETARDVPLFARRKFPRRGILPCRFAIYRGVTGSCRSGAAAVWSDVARMG
jgi:hypothetical protein